MKNWIFLREKKYNNIELHLLRSYLRQKKSDILADKQENIKTFNNYLRVKKLMDDSKK